MKHELFEGPLCDIIWWKNTFQLIVTLLDLRAKSDLSSTKEFIWYRRENESFSTYVAQGRVAKDQSS